LLFQVAFPVFGGGPVLRPGSIDMNG